MENRNGWLNRNMPLSRRRKVLFIVLVAIAFCVAGLMALRYRRVVIRGAIALSQRVRGRATVRQRVQEFGPVVHDRLTREFERAAIAYPPAAVVLVGLKQERFLRVYARQKEGELRHIKDYPVLAASGNLGPKLKEGDMQVPEGIYTVSYLNPNSMFHLSIGVAYPNNFDKARAREDGRRELGADIMIHGNEVSAGCLAMGDQAAEDLFVLTAETGVDNVKIVLAPTDLRYADPKLNDSQPGWLPQLYDAIRRELNELPVDES